MMNLAARLWTAYIFWMLTLVCGSHTELQYSRPLNAWIFTLREADPRLRRKKPIMLLALEAILSTCVFHFMSADRVTPKYLCWWVGWCVDVLNVSRRVSFSRHVSRHQYASRVSDAKCLVLVSVSEPMSRARDMGETLEKWTALMQGGGGAWSRTYSNMPNTKHMDQVRAHYKLRSRIFSLCLGQWCLGLRRSASRSRSRPIKSRSRSRISKSRIQHWRSVTTPPISGKIYINWNTPLNLFSGVVFHLL